ncbi:hypothetical protein KBY88_11550 [Cyanobium sp. Morenito 9A2]|nr:hypothetical protein [Cyanobium sp. Morenito 9A2]
MSIPSMREIVFELSQERPGFVQATAPQAGLTVESGSIEGLHHEAREALIQHLGAVHATYRIRLRRLKAVGAGALHRSAGAALRGLAGDQRAATAP